MRATPLASGLAAAFFLAWACSPSSETIPGTGGSPPTSTEESSTTEAPSSPASTVASTASAGGNGGAGGACDLSSPNTCETAEILTEVDGDQGNEVTAVEGVGSKWFQIKIVEATTVGRMSYTATLTSAMGTDYDLYISHGDDNGPDCTFPQLPANGMPESLTQYWNDLPGNDDSRHLSLEIRHVSGGTCDETAQWTLTVQGNTDPN